ncbi:MAG: M48 family metallopeptidase [Desulfobacterales bacterium]|nr:M48 family metallopeptidase [Desulfobacterales bacterium]
MTQWQDRHEFKRSVLSWAEKLDINVASIYLRPMKNKWASCSTNGNLNFNDRLLNLEKILGEYVIIHELLHFRVANHGSLWKSYMNAYFPEWENIDRKLKQLNQKKMEH